MVREQTETEDELERRARRHLRGALVPPGGLYHYTDAIGFDAILQSRALRASHYSQLNDYTELLRAEAIVNELAEQELRQATNPLRRGALFVLHRVHAQMPLSEIVEVYIVSFSLRGDMFAQWETYSAKSTGFCLGFGSLPLPGRQENPDAKTAVMLNRCVYREREFRALLLQKWQRILDELERFATGMPEDEQERLIRYAGQLLLRATALRTPKLKHSSFESEREMRLVVMPFGEHKDEVVAMSGEKRYVYFDLAADGDPLPLVHVRMGPAHDRRDGKAAAMRVLRSRHSEGVPVDFSEVPLRREQPR
jgi:Protein of unknown function (DUF2971)